MAWIQTYTGKAFDPFNPDPAKINIEDIAHSLANQCRFNGHTRQFYSVAQHCVEVASRVRPEQQALALLHDASEAYLSDLPTPIKYKPEFEFYRKAEELLQDTIYERFKVLSFRKDVDEVKRMDKQVLLMEVGLLLGYCEVPWNDAILAHTTPARERAGWKALKPEHAEREFLNVFYLTIEANGNWQATKNQQPGLVLDAPTCNGGAANCLNSDECQVAQGIRV